jgi:hypothetical protein
MPRFLLLAITVCTFFTSARGADEPPMIPL